MIHKIMNKRKRRKKKMKYRNVFSVIKESDKAADFIYCIYVMFCEKKDEEVEKQIHEEVKRIWSENEPHLTVTNLMLLFEDDILKKAVSLLYPKEEKEKDGEFYIGFLTDESEVSEVGLSEFQKQAVIFYSKFIE